MSFSHQSVGHKVIIKHADHYRVRNERDVLVRFGDRTPHLWPLLDEVELEGRAEWPALVLRDLDDDLLACSGRRKLSRGELKSVGKGVLEALEVLHGEGLVHTGTISVCPTMAKFSRYISIQTPNPAMFLWIMTP